MPETIEFNKFSGKLFYILLYCINVLDAFVDIFQRQFKDKFTTRNLLEMMQRGT